MQIRLNLLKEANQAMVDSRRARDENSSLFYCVQWQKVSQMFIVRVHYGGERRYLGLFHDEKDASLVVDEALRRLGAAAGARCNWLLDGTPTGYGRGAEAHAHQISGLLGAAKRKSVWFGVKEYRDPRTGTSSGFFVRLRLADCRWKSKKKPYPLPCAVTLRKENPVKCKCKTEQHNFTNPSGSYYKIEEEAARRYNEAVCDYGYHEPPYSMPLNPPAGVEWKLTSGS